MFLSKVQVWVRCPAPQSASTGMHLALYGGHTVRGRSASCRRDGRNPVYHKRLWCLAFGLSARLKSEEQAQPGGHLALCAGILCMPSRIHGPHTGSTARVESVWEEWPEWRIDAVRGRFAQECQTQAMRLAPLGELANGRGARGFFAKNAN